MNNSLIKLNTSLLLLIVVITISCSPKHRNNIITQKGIRFEKSKYLDDVLDKAKAEDKLVFIDFHAVWCVPCKIMAKDVFTDKDIAAFYNENFVNFKIDGESEMGENLVYLYQIAMYPTLLFLDSEGNIVLRNDGSLSFSAFRNLGEEAKSLKVSL